MVAFVAAVHCGFIQVKIQALYHEWASAWRRMPDTDRPKMFAYMQSMVEGQKEIVYPCPNLLAPHRYTRCMQRAIHVYAQSSFPFRFKFAELVQNIKTIHCYGDSLQAARPSSVERADIWMPDSEPLTATGDPLLLWDDFYCKLSSTSAASWGKWRLLLHVKGQGFYEYRLTPHPTRTALKRTAPKHLSRYKIEHLVQASEGSTCLST